MALPLTEAPQRARRPLKFRRANVSAADADTNASFAAEVQVQFRSFGWFLSMESIAD
jgi:hypothetical protein